MPNSSGPKVCALAPLRSTANITCYCPIMSCLTKSQIKYLNNNKKEKLYLSPENEGDDNFDFQYVPVSQFKHIIKDVRRQRIRDEEERMWTSYLKEQEQLSSNDQDTCSGSKFKSTRTLAESLQEVDRELMRLEADNLPETRGQNDFYMCRNTQEKMSPSKSSKKDSPVMKENGTGSTNFLLTIPEEESIYCMTESSEHGKTYVRKTCSDRTFKNEKSRSRCCHYSTGHLAYNSSPDISPDRFSDNDNEIPVHPDPMAVTKILAIHRKISTVLDSISYEIDRIPLPDGENDLQRRQQRVLEFSTRLSRNYLYDLGRQISDIKRHIQTISPRGKIKLSRRGIIMHMQAIEQKLISAHQLLLTALSAYWKHIPSSVLKHHPGKLKDILQIVVELKNICNELNLTPEFYCSGDDIDTFLGKETENRCSEILNKFKLHSDNDSQAPSHTTRSKVVTPSRVKRQKSKKMLSNRLSMYAMDMRMAKSYQPRKTHSMYQIPRDKKHNCLLSKQQQNNLPALKKSRLPPYTKSISETVGNKTTKITVPLKEDDIQTIMETVPSEINLESPHSITSNTKYKVCKDGYQRIEINPNSKESERLNKSKVDNNKDVKKDNDVKEKCFSSLLPVIGDLLSLVQNKNNQKTLPPVSIDSIYEFLNECQLEENTNASKEKSKHYKNWIEAGPKNMRLICYTTTDELQCNKTTVNIQEHKEIIQINDASCQANHLKNNGSTKLVVPESIAATFTDYRNQYQCFLKSNSMYTSSTQNKPWELVAWIADKLVDELIVELSEDFQMEDVIQKLFDLEFQEF